MPAVTAVPNYSTFLEQHLERGRLPEREPESMGQLDESTPLAGPTFARERPSPWKRFVSKAVPKSASRTFYHLLVAVMVFLVVMGSLGWMAGKGSDDVSRALRFRYWFLAEKGIAQLEQKYVLKSNWNCFIPGGLMVLFNSIRFSPLERGLLNLILDRL